MKNEKGFALKKLTFSAPVVSLEKIMSFCKTNKNNVNLKNFKKM